MIDLTGKSAIVAGGASDVGRGVALVLAEQGADIVICDLDVEFAQETAEKVEKKGRRALTISADVTDRAAAAEMLAKTVKAFGKIDILVNDASVIGAPNWWERSDRSDHDWSLAMSANLRAVVNASEAVAQHMKERHYGKIVNIASIAARQGGADVPHYNAASAAVVSWTKFNALELASFDINVNAVCPGLLWTPMRPGLVERMGEVVDDPTLRNLTGREYFDQMVEAAVPMKKEQTPEDVGKLAAFLASDDAQGITGQAIGVDGGRRIG